MTLDFVSNQEIIATARKRLTQNAWDYITGGTESETTLRRNRMAFDEIAFRPRVLVDVSRIDATTTFLGHKLRIPALLAPIGDFRSYHPDGAVAASQAAAKFGTVQVISTVTQPSLEEIAASTPAPKIFQLAVHGDDKWLEDILSRVKKSGYAALTLTVDNQQRSRHERWMMGRGESRSKAPVGHRPSAALTWEVMDRIKAMGGLPFLLKGVQTAEDAALAVEHGVDAVWVSNHGGRQLDHALGTMHTLPEVVAAVAGRVPVVVDGGVQRGSDILKALALGADAVAVGRLQGFALAAAGPEGVVRMMEILEEELMCAMGSSGISNLSQITPKLVTKAPLVTTPHLLSSWPSMPKELIP